MGWLSVVRIDVEDADDTRLMVSYCTTCAEAVLGREHNIERADAETREASKGLLEALNARLEREAARLERDRADDVTH